MKKKPLVKKALLELINSLSSADPKDDRIFQKLIDKSLNLMNISEADFAERIGVSRPTINRWRSGRTAPHPALRNHVYNYLCGLAQRWIKNIVTGFSVPSISSIKGWGINWRSV